MAQVPGEMFTLAMEAKKTRDMGVVGSTSNILDFIASKVKCALDKPFADKLQVSDDLVHVLVSVPIQRLCTMLCMFPCQTVIALVSQVGTGGGYL